MSEANAHIDATIATALSGALELAINTALKYDPATRQKIAALTDILAIHINKPKLSLYFCGMVDGIRIMHICETPATTEVTGSLTELFTLIQQPGSLAESDVSVSGKIGVLQQWQDALSDIDIDWEDALASVLGDFTPYAATAIKKTASYAHQQQKEIRRLAHEYVVEEMRITPSEPELEQFFDNVRDVSLAVDRIGARIARLQQILNKKG